MKALIIIALVALVIICGPLASIWAVNTLFGLTIPFTFETWAASFILTGAITARKSS